MKGPVFGDWTFLRHRDALYCSLADSATPNCPDQ